MPTVQNGMLVFTDTAQFYGYLNFLDSTMESPTTDTTIDNDSLLQGIESSIGFQSLRSIKHAAFVSIEDGAGWTTADQAVQDETWVPKDIASLLNVNHDVQVGTNIVHYINRDLQVVVAANQGDLLNQFHNLDTSATTEDALSIDPARLYSSVFDFKDGGNYILGSVPIDRPTGTGPLRGSYEIVDLSLVHPCGYPLRVIFKHLSLLRIGTIQHVAATYHIDFGDGTSTNVSSPILGTYYYVPEFYHDYPNYGSYTLTITAYPNGVSGYVQDTWSVPVQQSGCKESNQNYGSGWHYKAIDGSHWLYGQVYLHHIHLTQFSDVKSRVYVETKLVKKKSNGNYTRYKGSKTEHVFCQTKDNNCINQGTAIDGTNSGYGKTISLHQTRYGTFCFNAITSDHHYGSTVLNISYIPCQ